ncbi:glycosyltransferase [Planobispora longispora]
MAALMAGAGHQVVVITESSAESLTSLADAGVVIVPPLPADPDWRYLSPVHEYADRVSRTLASLDDPVDVLEAPVAGAESFTAVRVRRLLGGRRAPVVARLTVAPAPAPPVTFHDDIRAFAEDYVLRHCDAISRPLGGGARDRVRGVWPTPLTTDPPARPTIEDPVRRIVFLGELSRTSGVETFLDVADRLASFTVVVAGHDTPTDPFGRSYAASLRSAATILRDTGDLDEILAKPAILLVPDLSRASADLLDAAAARGAVIVGGGASAHPHVLTVPDTSPRALADAVLRWSDRPEELEAWSRAARHGTLRRCRPAAVARSAERLYATLRERPPRARRVSRRHRVSFVIPLYNQGAFVREAVASARATRCDGADVEIVVVDDGSTDDRTRRVFDGLDGVTKVRQRNKGLAGARNAGIRASSGDLVVPLDADDLVAESFTGKALGALADDDALAYVSCYSRNFGLFGGVLAAVGNVPGLMPFLHTDARCTSLYRRTALDRVGGYDEEMPAYEDWDLQIRLRKAGLLGDVIPEALFFYRRHPGSLVHRYSNAARVELIQYLMRKHADLLEPQGLDLALKLIDLWRNKFEPSESMRFRDTNDL